ncbi:acetoin dehydrogenase dihydrolipoyllysine-residue acetyltransferase subunit [Paraburkholderia sp.]|uniref:acetoin dehydrogenase dihydrolipoyllysine-residue acetyltransferase subunit n=1 Tax=Paraburkholderia sp. TaxID=1926495 RepID=UPI00262F5095|nr:acetoin dehydrogenase dihydrolipoyllysine-residue acetyltransferase subunit [Paraburkholderia sp.]
MPTEVILPRVDMDMTEGMIAAWHVDEGDEVREGMLIFEIETSKATMEIDAPASGIIRQINAPVGESVPVGKAVAWIYAAGEALVDHRERGGAAVAGGASMHPEEATQGQTQTKTPQTYATEAYEYAAPSDQNPHAADDFASTEGQEPLRATPAARRLAREHELRLVEIAGSGPHGRIAAQDVLRAAMLEETPGQVLSSAPHTRLHSITLRKGSGDPLVLLHGFAAESNSWRPFSQAVVRLGGTEAGMLAVDLPAHGKSPVEAAGSLEDMVAALEQTLLDAGIERCHLVGHSCGGALALATSAQASRLEVRSLALLAPAGLGPESNGAFLRGLTDATRRSSLVPWLRQLFADPARLDEGFVATAWQQLESPEVRERLAMVADTFFPDGTQMLDLRHLLNDLTMPVRVLWGQQDRILPVRHADGLPGHIAVHRFTGVGHLPYVEAEAEVARVVVQNMASAMAVNTSARVAIR